VQPSNTILVVDDEKGILDTYRHYLSPDFERSAFRSSRATAAAGSGEYSVLPSYRLLVAETGEAAVRLVEEELGRGQRVAAGLFDMKMPGGIDGLETIRRVRSLDPDLLCSVVTAYQDRSIDDINRIFAGGHEDEWDYVNKPFTQAEIRQKARNLVSSWNRRRRQEEQRHDLERLIGHLSPLKGFRSPDLAEFLTHLLRQLVELTASRGGLIATVDGGCRVVAANGDLENRAAADALLARADLAGTLREATANAEVRAGSGVSVVPLIGAQARRVALLLHDEEPSEDRRKLMRVFAENACAALDNHALYRELRDSNAGLSERVAAQTQDLRGANIALQRKTDELEMMIRTLKETERQLVQNEKLAVVGQLAAGVAHEINNPCAFILANLRELQQVPPLLRDFAALVGAGTPAADIAAWKLRNDFDTRLRETEELTAESIDGTQRVAKIVAELRSLGRSDEEELEPVEVDRLLDKALRVLDNEIRHKTTVVREYSAVPLIAGRAGQLLQVFLNLIMNAVQAMQGADQERNRLGIRVLGHDDSVRILVSDTGSGIPAAQIDKIFDPFFTTKPVGEGTGLGLTISHRIVEEHGGSIDVESVPGQGTAFVITLPSIGGA